PGMEDLRPGTRFDIAATAALLAEPARVAMLSALMDGEARPATELARLAHVSPSTGSAHLAALVRGGLLPVERLGRHRYHRLASPRQAHWGPWRCSLLVLARRPRPPASRRASSRPGPVTAPSPDGWGCGWWTRCCSAGSSSAASGPSASPPPVAAPPSGWGCSRES